MGGQRGGASRKGRLRRRRPSSRVIGCCALSVQCCIQEPANQDGPEGDRGHLCTQPVGLGF